MTSRTSTRRWAVVQFPGSNCDLDTFKTFQAIAESTGNIEVIMHWHEEPIQKNQYEVIALPGGFSFGDYLRAGAIAKLSAAVQNLEDVVEAGAHLIGICNGFQILLEQKLLPGYLQVNSHLRFISKTENVEIAAEAFPWFSKEDVGAVVRYPIAHRFGNYQLQKIDLAEFHPVLKYQQNPNGSYESTAGIYRKLGKGSLFGLMPHPERAAFEALKLADGLKMFQRAEENLRADRSGSHENAVNA
ncbi:MAG: phosphoribosylformylglycinamidine synthase subunit PurQ [Deltaproteobacteria bacterium]|nr:phosphoribosylformylglycinamidine synthase subunit PurQ [Deltaproteobacteria bacterium]